MGSVWGVVSPPRGKGAWGGGTGKFLNSLCENDVYSTLLVHFGTYFE